LGLGEHGHVLVTCMVSNLVTALTTHWLVTRYHPSVTLLTAPLVAAISRSKWHEHFQVSVHSLLLQTTRSHMENLSLHDAGPQGHPGLQSQGQDLGMPPPVPQLPPQMFTTAAQLLDLTDSECAVAHAVREHVC